MRFRWISEKSSASSQRFTKPHYLASNCGFVGSQGKALHLPNDSRNHIIWLRNVVSPDPSMYLYTCIANCQAKHWLADDRVTVSASSIEQIHTGYIEKVFPKKKGILLSLQSLQECAYRAYSMKLKPPAMHDVEVLAIAFLA